MTGDTPEPVTTEVGDLRQFLGECTRGILDAIPQLPRPEAGREAAQLGQIGQRKPKVLESTEFSATCRVRAAPVPGAVVRG
jgi:hypothetical protein